MTERKRRNGSTLRNRIALLTYNIISCWSRLDRFLGCRLQMVPRTRRSIVRGRTIERGSSYILNGPNTRSPKACRPSCSMNLERRKTHDVAKHGSRASAPPLADAVWLRHQGRMGGRSERVQPLHFLALGDVPLWSLVTFGSTELPCTPQISERTQSCTQNCEHCARQLEKASKQAPQQTRNTCRR